MIDTIRNAWKIIDLRKKILYTILMIIIFRLGSCIPVPLLDPAAMKEIFTSDNSLFGFIDVIVRWCVPERDHIRYEYHTIHQFIDYYAAFNRCYSCS